MRDNITHTARDADDADLFAMREERMERLYDDAQAAGVSGVEFGIEAFHAQMEPDADGHQDEHRAADVSQVAELRTRPATIASFMTAGLIRHCIRRPGRVGAASRAGCRGVQ